MSARYAVFGHPIHHSLSPKIHTLFAQQTNRKLSYEAICVPLDQFSLTLDQFFQQGGCGGNVTVPFKQEAYHYCSSLTDRARLAGAVNTLVYQAPHHCLGDNTDGIGLVTDLERLAYLPSSANVLLVGAGGAARGVVLPLLEKGAKITVVNRTRQHAQCLASEFKPYGQIADDEMAEIREPRFDLIINATSSGIQGDIPALSPTLITPQTAVYDMFYQATLTPFLAWAQQHHAGRVADGLGMLVGQAAHAFYLWQGIMPDIVPVLATLRASFHRQ